MNCFFLCFRVLHSHVTYVLRHPGKTRIIPYFVNALCLILSALLQMILLPGSVCVRMVSYVMMNRFPFGCCHSPVVYYSSSPLEIQNQASYSLVMLLQSRRINETNTTFQLSYDKKFHIIQPSPFSLYICHPSSRNI
jgi:hypothetical protein